LTLCRGAIISAEASAKVRITQGSIILFFVLITGAELLSILQDAFGYGAQKLGQILKLILSIR
jgi:hypothetical protein